MAVHGLEHVQARPVQPDEWEVVIKRGEPPFVGVMLIGHQIRNVPGEEVERLSGQAQRFSDGGSWLHSSGACDEFGQGTRVSCIPARRR